MQNLSRAISTQDSLLVLEAARLHRGARKNYLLAMAPALILASMNLKSASLLALIGTTLVTALLAWDFVFNLLNVLRGLVPAVVLFSSLIYAFGAFSVAVFFFVFHKGQS